MLVGTPKEIKDHEDRVGLVPSSVRELVAAGHKVIIEKNAGAGIGIADAAYVKAGAAIVDSPDEIFATADMVVKVKEPLEIERKKLREGQTLWTVSNAYGLSMTELLRLNPQIAKPNEVQSGTRVRVR